MPAVKECERYFKKGYQSTKGSTMCHLYEKGDENSRLRAFDKALKDYQKAEKKAKLKRGNLFTFSWLYGNSEAL